MMNAKIGAKYLTLIMNQYNMKDFIIKNNDEYMITNILISYELCCKKSWFFNIN